MLLSKRIRVVLWIALATLVHGATAPFAIEAETPWSSRRASGLGVFALSTASDYLDRPAGMLLPWSSELRFDPHGGNSTHFGASRELFGTGPQSDKSGVLIGNEVGDPLWQELKGKNANRTPTTQPFFSLPLQERFTVWGELRQVDHWSQLFAGMRKQRSVPSGQWGETPRELHSWFGENYPDFSLLSGGVEFRNSRSFGALQARSAWWWLPSPGSRRELPLRVDELQGQFEMEGWGVRSRRSSAEIVDRSDRSGSRLEVSELLFYGRQQVEEELWRPWLLIRQEDVVGDFPLTPEYGFRAVIGLDRALLWNNYLRFSGSHWIGGSEWGVNDTLELRWGSERGAVRQRAIAQLSNRLHPFGAYLETDDAGKLLVDLTHRSSWQHYALQSEWHRTTRGWSFRFSSTPWVGRDLPRFEADRYSWQEKRYTRSGRMTTLQGNLWGAQQRAVVAYSRCPLSSFELEHINDWKIAGEWSQVDLEPAAHRLALRHRRSFLTGFDLRTALLYTTGATIHHQTPVPFQEPDHFELNIEMRQRLFDGRAEVWFSLLNPLALDRPLAPNGADDRFRAVAGGNWRF